MIQQNVKIEIYKVVSDCTFFAEINGYHLIFEQYDNEPVTLNMDSLREALGVKNLTFISPGLISHLVEIAIPAIEHTRYQFRLIEAFSEN